MFVASRFMAKYPPGHSLVLVPGVWVGLPGLMPVVLAGISGTLVFSLARRVANEWVALMTWSLWVTAPGTLRFLPSYFSQTSSVALWLLGFWILLKWRDTGLRRWLVLLVVCIGIGWLTHPFTWVLYALPVGVVVVVFTIRWRHWLDLSLPSVIALALVALVCLWNLRTTGNPLEPAWSVYAREYFPWDRVGFGVDTTAPLRQLPPDMVHFANTFRALHSNYRPSVIPLVLAQRLVAISQASLGGGAWRAAIAPFAIMCLLAMSIELGFALCSSALLVLGFLAYAHFSGWTLYYIEIIPILAFATAVGLQRGLVTLIRGSSMIRDRLPPPTSAVRAAMFVVWLCFTPFAGQSLVEARQRHRMEAQPLEDFRSAIPSASGRKVLLFVRYSPSHNPNTSFIFNNSDLGAANAWVVYDRGAANDELIRIAPDRVPFLFDQPDCSIVRLDNTGAAIASTRVQVSRTLSDICAR